MTSNSRRGMAAAFEHLSQCHR